MSRRDELRTNLETLERRIEAACSMAGRHREELTLIVVTKTYPATDVDLLAELGVTNVGENRHPEAGNKFAEVDHDLRWHFVGGLQSNKAAAVCRYADVIHSVDRLKLVPAIDKGARAAGRVIDCLIQVSLSDDEGRSGAVPDAVMGIAAAIESADAMRLTGVMAVAPLGADPDEAFVRLKNVSERVEVAHPDATDISAGMSGDLEAAVKAGATHLRIGRSVLGARPATG